MLQSFKYGHVLKNVTKIVNYIHGRALNHHRFSKFLEDVGGEYTDLPYYTEIRWLSSHKVLKRIVQLLNKIIIFFLESKNYECEILKDDQWIKDLAFAVDIKDDHLSQLNLKLQDRQHVVTTLFDNINVFKQKLLLWQKQIQKESCQSLLQNLPQFKFLEYANQIKLLEKEFERRFLDKKCENQFQLLTSPLSIDVKTVDENL